MKNQTFSVICNLIKIRIKKAHIIYTYIKMSTPSLGVRREHFCRDRNYNVAQVSWEHAFSCRVDREISAAIYMAVSRLYGHVSRNLLLLLLGYGIDIYIW